MKHFFYLKTMFTLIFVGLLCVEGWGQTTIHTNACASATSGWTFTNGGGVIIQQGDYWLVDNVGDAIISETFNVSSYTGLTLTFKVGTYGSGTNHSCRVEYSTDNGSTWNASYFTSATPTSATLVTAGTWNLGTINTTQLKFRWTTPSGGSKGVRIDDILFQGVATPTTQTSQIAFPTVTSNSLGISWTNGNGSSRIVFLKENSGTITNPTNGTIYTASTDWSAKGTQLESSGYYCVYNGTGTSVTINNLSSGTPYYVQAFEYNGTGGTSNFYTNTASNNPNNQTTNSSSIPTISVGTINNFGNQVINTTSGEQHYSLTGSNLTANILITPPAGFQISELAESGYTTDPITLTHSGGTVGPTTIYVKFTPTTLSTYPGNITHTSVMLIMN